MREMLDSKMQAKFSELDEKMSRLSNKTEKRLDVFDKNLKQVEADTYWKIKDYEKLLEQRPTTTFVKKMCADEGRGFMIKCRDYTDEEIKKLNESAGAIANTFNVFKIATSSTLSDF